MEGKVGWSNEVIPRGHCCETEVCVVSSGFIGICKETEGYFDPFLDREDCVEFLLVDCVFFFLDCVPLFFFAEV
jgi:hypothetical protein